MADRVQVPIDLNVESIKMGKVSFGDLEKSVQSSMQGIAKTITDTLKTVNDSNFTERFNANLTKSYDSLTKKYQTMLSAKARYDSSLVKAGETSTDYQTAKKVAEENLKMAQKAKAEFLAMFPSDIANGQAAYGMGGSTQKSTYAEIMAQFDKAIADAQANMPKPEAFVSTATDEGIQKVIDAFNRFTRAASEAGKAKEDFDQKMVDNKFTDEYAEKLKSVDKLKTKMEELNAKSKKMEAVGAGGQAWKSLQYEAQQTSTEMESLIRQMRTLVKEGKAFRFGDDGTGAAEQKSLLKSLSGSRSANLKNINARANANLPTYTEDYEKKLKELDALEKKIDTIKEKAAKMNALGGKDSSWKSLLYDAEALKGKVSQLTGELQNMVRDGKAFRIGGDADAEIGNLASRSQELMSRLSGIKREGEGAGSTVRKAFSGIISACKSAIKLIGKLASKLRESSKSSDSLGTRMKHLWKNILMYGLGARSLYLLVRRLRTAVIKTFQEMAKKSPEINTQVSSIQTSMNKLKGAASIAFEPLLEPLANILAKIAALAMQAANAIARMLSMFQGRGYVYKFTAANEDYAKSASAAGGAADKELHSLMGFDELNRLDDKSSGGGGGADSIGSWEKEEFEPTEFMKKLKAAWASANFTEIGTILATKFADMFNSVADWLNTKYGPFVSKLSDSLSSFINGFTVAGTGLSDAIGNFAGAGVNNTMSAIRDFFFNTDWEQAGTFIADSFNSIVSSIDWVLIGDTFANKWQAIIDFVWGVVSNVEWSELGTKLGTAMSGWLNGIDWSQFGLTLVTLLNGLVTTVTDFIANIDWYALGTNLMNSIESFINNLDFGELGRLVSEFVLAAIDLAFALVAETEWSTLLQSLVSGIGSFIENVDWGEILLKLVSIVVSLLLQLPSMVIGLLSGYSSYIASLFRTLGLDSIAGFFQGISDKLANVMTWMKENVVDPVVNAIKDLFGIHSPSTVFAEIGDNLIQGLFNGISEAWHLITDFFTTAWENMKTSWSTTWTEMHTAVTNIWNGITETIRSAINGIIGFINGMIRAVTNGLNAVINAANKLNFNIPDWVPIIGGNHFGLNIPTVSAPQIPYLAQGAVIPPNKEFAAVLGDQKNGTNIEAPLSTIQEAVAVVINDYIDGMMTGFQAVVDAINNKDMEVNIGDNAIGRAAARYNRKQNLVRG